MKIVAVLAVATLILAGSVLACWGGGQSPTPYPAPTAYPTYSEPVVETPSEVVPPSQPVADTSPEGGATAQAQGELESLYQGGMDAFGRGEWWEAADYLRQVTLFDPQYQDAGNMLAEARARLGVITFTRGGRDGTVYSVSPAGGLEAPLFGVEGAGHFVWSGDESEIAYVEGVGRHSQLGVMRADGSDRRILVRAGDVSVWEPQISDLDWSPDGTSIVFTAGSFGLWTVSASGGSPVSLPCTTIPYVADFPAPTVLSVSWSPGGQTIVFGTSELPDSLTMATDPQGTDCRKLPAFAYPVDVVWAPDGRRVAFWTEWYVERQQGLEIAGADGSDRAVFVGGYYGWGPLHQTNETIAWSPDGQYLAFINNIPNNVYIYVPSIDGVYKIADGVDGPLNWLSQ